MNMPHELRIVGNEWQFSVGDGRHNAFVLWDKENNSAVVEWGFAALNNLSEADAILEKCRFHERLDGVQADLETAGVYPFGGEAHIERTFAVRDGLIECCVDVKPGRGEAVRSLDLGTLTLPGTWSSAQMVRTLPPAGEPWQLETLDLSSETLYADTTPWVLLILADDAGHTVELGAGGDFWRLAANLPGNAPAWSIRKTADAVMVERQVLNFPAEAELERRPWRFNSYLAWDFGYAEGLPESAEVVELAVTGCRRAPAARKIFKKQLRQLAEQSAETPLVLLAQEPVGCNDAGHLERPGKVELLHWDLDELFALLAWGSRQLNGKRALHIAFPEESVWNTIPSGVYLASAAGEVWVEEE